MDNTKKQTTDTTNTKKSDRTNFADEINMDTNQQKQNHKQHNK